MKTTSVGTIGVRDSFNTIDRLMEAVPVVKLAHEYYKTNPNKLELFIAGAQAQANAESSEKAAMAEVQKQQALTAEKVAIEQAKANFEMQRMQAEAQIKKELMATEFQYNIQLAQAAGAATQQKEKEIEDRKDKRTKIQASQQSQMINQRQNDTLPTDFESAGNDNLGGFGLEQFNP
jgi:hypothetical protein